MTPFCGYVPIMGIVAYTGKPAASNMVQRDEPVAFGNEFLFQPQLFLKIFQLGEEIDDFAGDGAQCLDLVQAAFDVGEGGRVLDVVQVHHFVFDVKIQFAAQKAAQVFVDEIIGGVFGGIVGKVLFQQRAVWVFLGRCRLPNSLPIFAY